MNIEGTSSLEQEKISLTDGDRTIITNIRSQKFNSKTQCLNRRQPAVSTNSKVAATKDPLIHQS